MTSTPTQWRALLASAVVAVLGTAGILRAATSSPSRVEPTPAHRTSPVTTPRPMPGMHMSS